MRTLLSGLCMLLAGLLAAASLAGHQIDQLLREEEPIREVAGGLPAEEQFSQAVSEMLVDELSDHLPEAVQGLIGDRAETAVAEAVEGMLEDERTREAWDEVLQTTRSDYADQLDRLFHEGSSGDAQELAVELDLSPVAEALTGPLREGLESALGWLPGLDEESFEFLAPEVVVDVEAAAEDGADPYIWATLAAVSEHWTLLAIAAAVLTALGLLLGRGRGRWAALSLGGMLAAVLGVWVALTAASPDFGQPEGLPPAALAILDHVESGITGWAQPAWWIFSAASGVVALIGMLTAAVAPPGRPLRGDAGHGRGSDRDLDPGRTRPVDWPA